MTEWNWGGEIEGEGIKGEKRVGGKVNGGYEPESKRINEWRIGRY